MLQLVNRITIAATVMPKSSHTTLSIKRRGLLAWIGAGAASMMLGCHSKAASNKVASCILTPEQTEGPYFVDEKLERSDIRVDPSDNSTQSGLPLVLRISVMDAASCQPLQDAVVDVWHCNASGIYSDAKDRSFNTTGKKFLRGFQRTDANGAVQFLSIYPGWYEGRAVHIHFKIRTKNKQGKAVEFTSQLYFEDAVSDEVFSHAPYNDRGKRNTYNEQDRIYADGGNQLMLKPELPLSDGLTASITIGVQLGD